ncbi:MAG: M20/M25/M40 family metallo-hydrolase [Flavobacteriales bacterium]|nr:hypothetical protein [Flavobacteriales bacterium]MCC6578710.1 M20/M25/M40 family metallo-hydrolase [Flavobacteriales bacterium]NUQ15952.1 M20/M25/M40 family metallo-hydrolase [Flavobacteriales bacterium]
MKPLRIPAVLIPAVLLLGPARAQHPAVADMLNAARLDSMVRYLEEITGEVPVDVGNGPVTIVSRHKTAAGNAIAADHLQQRLAAWGYAPTVQTFGGGTGENVLAVKTGLVHPGRKVILCAHYDAMPGGPVAAPAADDDGSGTAAVLEAARVFASMDFERTVVFAFWDEEEQGLVGSEHFAGVAAANDDSIAAVVNMDAIAYDGNGDGLMRIHARAVANSLAIKDTALLVNGLYGLGANIAVNTPGALYSDHASFWAEDFGAILVIEDFDNDPNPQYHTPNDRLQFLDLPYYEQLAKLSLATAAHMAIPLGSGTGVAAATVPRAGLRVWPVPCDGTVNVHVGDASSGPWRIELLDPTGRTVRELHRGPLPTGHPRVQADLHGLPDGHYLVRATNNKGEVSTSPLVLLR